MFLGSKNHLKESQCSYFEHMKFALYAGWLLFIASIASFIHAFVPGFLKGKSAYTVIKLYHQRLVTHPNELYQKWIEDEINNKTNSSS